MPNWQAEKAERNRKSLARLAKSLPGVLAPPGPRIRCALIEFPENGFVSVSRPPIAGVIAENDS
jgi:hypothetical protein